MCLKTLFMWPRQQKKHGYATHQGIMFSEWCSSDFQPMYGEVSRKYRKMCIFYVAMNDDARGDINGISEFLFCTFEGAVKFSKI